MQRRDKGILLVSLLVVGWLLAASPGQLLSARAAEVPVTLHQGFNLFAFPTEVPTAQSTCLKLFNTLGGPDQVEHIARLDPVTQQYEMCDSRAAHDFLLRAGEAYIVRMKAASEVTFAGASVCPAHELRRGLNLLGVPTPPAGLTACALLERIGNQHVVSALQRFDPEHGAFDSCGYAPNGTAAQPAGTNFPIQPGEGYLLHLRSQESVVLTLDCVDCAVADCTDGDPGTLDLCDARLGCYHRAANREQLFALLQRTQCVAYAPRNFDPTRGIFPSDDSIRADLVQLAEAGFRCLWTFGSDGTLDHIPRLAKDVGYTLVVMGIFDPTSDEQLSRAEAQQEFVDAYRLGSEGLAFNRYTLDELLAARDRLRRNAGRPVTTSEPLGQFLTNAALRQAFDFIAANVHPFFAEITEPAAAVAWTLDRYAELTALSEQFVFLSEVGLPTCGDARVNETSQQDYYRMLSHTTVPFAFFEAYDQPWKQSLPVEPCWGLFHADGSPKGVVTVLEPRGAFEVRREALLAASRQPFSDDPLRNVETDLDRRSFEAINALVGPKLLDNATGWSVIARTGGRPFIAFDDIRLNGTPWVFDASLFAPGSSGIPDAELAAHFAAGKRVNRLWFTHRAQGDTHPIVVVFTPDGFFNVAGATAPLLLGSAFRTGFIGEPFGDTDYLQHVDAVDIRVIDDLTLALVADVHSQAGEGTLLVWLVWNAVAHKPELVFRAVQAPRLEARLGFAGFNFLRGPTLFGLLNDACNRSGGIAAFHDGRSVFVDDAAGAVLRNVLVPPLRPTSEEPCPALGPGERPIVRQDIATNVAPGSRLILDQPQNVAGYFSKTPQPPYDQRADLVLRLDTSTAALVVRRAQIAADLSCPNPEANETANVFAAAEMLPERLEAFTYTLTPEADDFEAQFTVWPQGVVFVSDRDPLGTRLYFMPLAADLTPLGAPEPLTDETIIDPRRPATSANGRVVVFDAATDAQESRHRIYALDLLRGTVRRLSVDPFGASTDSTASLSADGTQFALTTNRRGQSYLNIEAVSTGLPGCTVGHGVLRASDADWSHIHDEIAFVLDDELHRLDVGADSTLLVSRTGARSPAFSPDGEAIAYAADSGIYVVQRDGADDTLVIDDGEHPTWADAAHLIASRTVEGDVDLYVIEIATGSASRLTTDPAADTEPVFVPAIRQE